MEEQKTKQAVETVEKPMSEQEAAKACNEAIADVLKKYGFMFEVRLVIDPAAEVLRSIIQQRVEGVIALVRPQRGG